MTSSWKLARIALVLLVGYLSQTNGAPQRALAEPHVIGGVNTQIEDVPHQISLEIFRVHSCGGVIVSDKHVLTAGHCVASPLDMFQWATRIRAGSTIQVPLFNLFGGVIHHIQTIKLHPSFSPTTLDYDIAVITVSNNFAVTPQVKSISIPTEGEGFIDYNRNATVSGWGLTKIGAWFPPLHLQSAEIPLVQRSICKESHPSITPRMLCGAANGKNDINFGDSGGPLVHRGKLIGLSSWVLRNHDLKHPSGFSNLLDYDMRHFIITEAGV